MSDRKDKTPQPVAPVADDIELPLTTDWQPGSASSGRTRRRVTGGERPANVPASSFKVLPVDDAGGDATDAEDRKPDGAVETEPQAPSSAQDKTVQPAAPHAQKPVEAVTHIAHGKKPLPTPLATTPPPKHAEPEMPSQPEVAVSVSGDEDKAAKVGKQCPKCGYKNTSYYSCDRCGLVFANWRPELERAQYADVPEAIVEQAAGLWKAVINAADDAALETAVAAFHDFCQKSRAQSYAAVRYRAWSSTHPTDTIVRGYQQKMVSQAALMLPQTKQVDKKTSIGPTGLVIGLVVALILTGILTMLFLDYLGPTQ